MDSRFYHFEIGRFRCTAVSDGGHKFPLDVLFDGVPAEEVQAAVEEWGLPPGPLFTPLTCLAVDTGSQRILVDMGAGNTLPSAGRLRDNLTAAGIDPLQIDSVIITHAHADHIGGAVGDDGRLAYPNARYYIQRQEWDFWHAIESGHRAAGPHRSVAQERLPALADRLTFVSAGSEILPGVFAVDAAGHTPGHMALLFISDGSRLLHISDTALHPLHLEHTHWQPVYDVAPEQALQSKRRIFDRAAAEELLLFAHHLPPFPNLGTVVRKGYGWLWEAGK